MIGRLCFLAIAFWLLMGCAPPPVPATIAPAAPAPTATPTPTGSPTVTNTPRPTSTATPTRAPVITIIPNASASCPVTPLVRADAPPDGHADPMRDTTWAMNGDRSIWASVPLGGYRFEDGDKSYWVRPAGEQLTVSGHRLDGVTGPLKASIPCCYPTGFQIVGLDFPTKGCWTIDGKTAKSQLQYVTEIK